MFLVAAGAGLSIVTRPFSQVSLLETIFVHVTHTRSRRVRRARSWQTGIKRVAVWSFDNMYSDNTCWTCFTTRAAARCVFNLCAGEARFRRSMAVRVAQPRDSPVPLPPLARLSHLSMISSIMQAFGGLELDRCFGGRLLLLGEGGAAAARSLSRTGGRAVPRRAGHHAPRRRSALRLYAHASSRCTPLGWLRRERCLRRELLFCRPAARRRRLCD